MIDVTIKGSNYARKQQDDFVVEASHRESWELCTVRNQASRSNSHLPIDSFFKYFLSMLGLIKYSGVREPWKDTKERENGKR